MQRKNRKKKSLSWKLPQNLKKKTAKEKPEQESQKEKAPASLVDPMDRRGHVGLQRRGEILSPADATNGDASAGQGEIKSLRDKTRYHRNAESTAIKNQEERGERPTRVGPRHMQ